MYMVILSFVFCVVNSFVKGRFFFFRPPAAFALFPSAVCSRWRFVRLLQWITLFWNGRGGNGVGLVESPAFDVFSRD